MAQDILHRAVLQESFSVIRAPSYGTFCERANYTHYFRVFLNLGFGEPMFCTLDSRGFCHFRAFRDFRESSNQPPCLWLSELSSSFSSCGCLSCLRHFRHFRDSRRFREKHRIAKHRFGKT